MSFSRRVLPIIVFTFSMAVAIAQVGQCQTAAPLSINEAIALDASTIPRALPLTPSKNRLGHSCSRRKLVGCQGSLCRRT